MYDCFGFEKDLFNLMNNSLFEKTMTNVRKHRDLRLTQKSSQKMYQ